MYLLGNIVQRASLVLRNPFFCANFRRALGRGARRIRGECAERQLVMANWFDDELLSVLDSMFDKHSRSLCGPDCSFCADIRYSDVKANRDEYWRIQRGKCKPAKKKKRRKSKKSDGRAVKTGLPAVSSRKPKKSQYWLS